MIIPVPKAGIDIVDSLFLSASCKHFVTMVSQPIKFDWALIWKMYLQFILPPDVTISPLLPSA